MTEGFRRFAGGPEMVDATRDAFIGGRVMVRQPSDGRHRAGLDAVMLAATLARSTAGRVVDLGAGVGVAGMCLAARAPESRVVLVDNDPVAVHFAQEALKDPENAAFAKRIGVIECDITASERVREAAGLKRDMADHVIMNPPFHEAGAVRASPKQARAAAHVLSDADLEKWLRTAASILVDGGTIGVIWPAPRLLALLDGMKSRFGAISVLALHPRENEAAKRVILTGRKASRAPLRLLPGLVLHNDDGTPTRAAAEILRHGGALDFS